ncbi:MAG: phosphoribosylformylglycinamidine synthase, partial [Parolsenella sp.]|nr:phosphoribosylformylglycinamidine synthase [Parolsenella sp.]
MVSRIYVEKKPGFDVEAQQLAQELRTILGIGGLTGLRVINRYDVEGVDEALFQRCVPIVFSEPQVDTATAELPVEGIELDERGFVASAPAGTAVFAVEYLPGQFDQRADSASECVQLVSAGERPDVRSAKVYVLSGELSAADIDAIKHYVINPVEAREATLSAKATLKMEVATPADVEVLDAFLELDEAGLAAFIA